MQYHWHGHKAAEHAVSCMLLCLVSSMVPTYSLNTSLPGESYDMHASAVQRAITPLLSPFPCRLTLLTAGLHTSLSVIASLCIDPSFSVISMPIHSISTLIQQKLSGKWQHPLEHWQLFVYFTSIQPLNARLSIIYKAW